MKEKKNKDKIWLKVCELVFVYKEYFPGIIACLFGASVLTFLQPLIIRKITDEGMMQRDMQCILTFSATMLFVSLFSQWIEVIQIKLFSELHNNLSLSLYKKAYNKMENLSIDYYDEKGSAEIVSTVTADIENIISITDQITGFSIASILQIIGGLVGLAIIDWKLTFLILIVIPIKYWIVLSFSQKKNKAFEQLIENNRKFFSWIGDCISGIREMKLWDLFRVRGGTFGHYQERMMSSYKENMLLDGYCTLWVAVLDALLSALLYILGGYLIVKGKFTIGGAFAFITYSNYVVSPISFLINIKYYFAQIKPSAKRFFTFLGMPEEEVHSGEMILSDHTTANVQDEVSALEMLQVCFGYSEDMPVLKDINLKVHYGEKVGIIGKNGSGKSTILNLILGFHKPDKGTIKLGGIPVQKLGLANIREKFAVVSQKPYFFQGTIEENVNVDGKASHEEVIDACKKSGAEAFVKELEEGYQHVIGQDGGKLSGGAETEISSCTCAAEKSGYIASG